MQYLCLSPALLPPAFCKQIFILRFIRARNGIRSPRLWLLYASRRLYNCSKKFQVVTTAKCIYAIVWLNSYLGLRPQNILIEPSDFSTLKKKMLSHLLAVIPHTQTTTLRISFTRDSFKCENCAWFLFWYLLLEIVGRRGEGRVGSSLLILQVLLFCTNPCSIPCKTHATNGKTRANQSVYTEHTCAKYVSAISADFLKCF